MNKQKKKFDPIVLILDLVIIAMLFWVFVAGIELYSAKSFAKEASSFAQDSRSMAYELERNDYAALIQGKYMNEITGNNGAKSYHALADYIEAVSLYKVYAEKGYTEKALVQKKIMDSSRKDMKDLKILADKVDTMFGVK